jgi:hypothetical protein
MQSLPSEAIDHIVAALHPGALLAARGACKMLHAAIPLERVLGIDKPTARWLMQASHPQRWLRSNEDSFTVCVHDSSIAVYTQHDDVWRLKTESHQPPLRHASIFPSVRKNHHCAISHDELTATLALTIATHDEGDIISVLSNAGDGGAWAFCEVPGIVYMVSGATGVVHSLDVDQDVEEICHDFAHRRVVVASIESKKRLLVAGGVAKMETVDGKSFTFLTNTGTLLHRTASGQEVAIAAAIKDFWLINSTAAVCWMMVDGGAAAFRLAHLPSGRFTATVPLLLPADPVVVHVTPTLGCMWVLDARKRLFRVSG